MKGEYIQRKIIGTFEDSKVGREVQEKRKQFERENMKKKNSFSDPSKKMSRKISTIPSGLVRKSTRMSMPGGSGM